MTNNPGKPIKPITLKELAEHLELSRSTVSRIVNGEATAHRIAEETQQRVLHAAALLGYSANSVARSLRQKRSYTIGVIIPEISEGYSTGVLSGIEDELLSNGYFYFVVSHRHRKELLEGYPRMLIARTVEGIIAIDTPLGQDLPVPLVYVSGHRQFDGAVTIELDHARAAHLALSHLKQLGHTRIAYIKGQSFSSDTEQRWCAIVKAAQELDIPVDSGPVVQLESGAPGRVLRPRGNCWPAASPSRRSSPLTTSPRSAPSWRLERLGCASRAIFRCSVLTMSWRLRQTILR